MQVSTVENAINGRGNAFKKLYQYNRKEIESLSKFLNY